MTVKEAKDLHREIMEGSDGTLREIFSQCGIAALWSEEGSCAWDEIEELNFQLTKDGFFFVGRYKIGKKSHKTLRSQILKPEDL